jgi:NhaA family Na+:H+ antiporter
MYLSGVHPTIAGVLLATTIPARPRIHINAFIENNLERLREMRDRFGLDDDEAEEKEQESISVIEENCERVQTPLQRLEQGWHFWISFLIMPLFALANAGVPINTGELGKLGNPLSLGIIFGLLLGKPIGITVFTWLSIKMKMAALPSNSRWIQVLGIGFLGGIGFTMSIFIADLAFGLGEFLDLGKIAILTGSLLSSLVGVIILLMVSRKASV